MLSGDGNENVTCSTLFWYISMPLFCTTTTRNFQTLPSYMFYRGLKFLFSHRSYEIFTFFFQWNWSPLFFLSLALALSLLSTLRQCRPLKCSRKKGSALLLLYFILSKSPASGHEIYRRNARVLEMQNFTPAFMNGWTYVRIVRTILSELTFLECIAKQIFLPMELRFDYY